jgi:transposase, IS30 family
MGTRYSQLTPVERNRIEALLKLGKNLTEIGHALGRHKSTISRELCRNAWNGCVYFATTAHIQSSYRRHVASSRMKVDPETWKLVESKLKLKWSPEQISARLKLESKGSISASTIYNWIWLDRKGGGELFRNLRISNRRRKKRNIPLRQKGPIQNEKGIKLRPKIVEKRKRLGDLEGDTIHFSKDRKAGLLTITDRVSKRVQIRKLKRRQARPTAQKSIQAINSMKSSAHTLTLDRGTEFAHFKQVEKETGAQVYFADPYTASQRGSIENQNGLIRQFFPRSSKLKSLNGPTIKKVERLLNERPRKTLGYLTPIEYENKKKMRSLF